LELKEWHKEQLDKGMKIMSIYHNIGISNNTYQQALKGGYVSARTAKKIEMVSGIAWHTMVKLNG